jgi:phosphoglycolate phosphatase
MTSRATCTPVPGPVPGSIIAAAARDRRHLLFDLDGTLVDSNATCMALVQAMLAARGSTRRIDPAAGRAVMSYGGLRMIHALLAQDCGDAVADLAEFRARYLVATTGVDTLYDGVLPGVQRLADAGFTMGICSNKPQALCEKVLADTGLDAFMAAVVGAHPARAPKPASDPLDLALDLLTQHADACIFIGDSELDYRVARNAGVPFAFMTYGYADSDWQPEAAHDWHDTAGQGFDHFDHLVDALVAGTQVQA